MIESQESFIGNRVNLSGKQDFGRVQVLSEGDTEVQVNVLPVGFEESWNEEQADFELEMKTYALQNRESEADLIRAGFDKIGENYVRDSFTYTPAKMYYDKNEILPGIFEIQGNQINDRLVKI